jgi:hypothetical protein
VVAVVWAALLLLSSRQFTKKAEEMMGGPALLHAWLF